ncbi:MAG: hypothetical protein IJC45_05425 [Clostridia bacterium]|nr:hypothetical protein [Clostridia bacterium]
MKTYNYRKWATLAYFFSAGIMCFFIAWFFVNLLDEIKYRLCSGYIALFVIFLYQYVPEYLNRKIELNDEHCRFISFRVRMERKPVTITTQYKDISYIKVRPCPFIGFRKMTVKISHYGKTLTISPFYTDRIELFSTLCEKVRQYNPDADIDPRLFEYLEKVKSK